MSQSFNTYTPYSIRGLLLSMLTGIVIVMISVWYLLSEEHHRFCLNSALADSTKNLIIASPTSIDAKNDGHSIYVTGMLNTSDVLKDPFLDVSIVAIRMYRTVEMYQWQEFKTTRNESQSDGSVKSVDDYSYFDMWYGAPIVSASFHDSGKHQNPAITIRNEDWTAQNVNVGVYALPYSMISEIGGNTLADLKGFDFTALKNKLHKPVTVTSEGVFIGNNPQKPEIGDLKIKLYVVLPQQVSIIARQWESAIQRSPLRSDSAVELTAIGRVEPQVMLKNAVVGDYTLCGLLLLFIIIGVRLFLQPAIPLAYYDFTFFVSITNFGLRKLTIIIALLIWLFCLGISWFICVI